MWRLRRAGCRQAPLPVFPESCRVTRTSRLHQRGTSGDRHTFCCTRNTENGNKKAVHTLFGGAANGARSKGRSPVACVNQTRFGLKWQLRLGILPTRRVIEVNAKFEHLKNMKWSKTRHISPATCCEWHRAFASCKKYAAIFTIAVIITDNYVSELYGPCQASKSLESQP